MNSQSNSRQIAVAQMKASVTADTWQTNSEFVAHLHNQIQHHAISSHPAISALNKCVFSEDDLRDIHLDYRHAIVQIFTDALLMSQYQCRQLEPRLASGEKMFPRFLLTLNILDEFGFDIEESQDSYVGTPHNAHYPLYEKVLSDLDISEEDRRAYLPSDAATQLRDYLESAYSDLNDVVSLLCVAEEVVVLFSAPLRRSVKDIGLDVSTGYYWFHGTSDDADSNANDDTHASDLRHILMQSLLSEDHDRIEALCMKYCDIWVKFWDYQMERLLHRRIQESSNARAEALV